MSSPAAMSTITINFRGVKLTLPADVPFDHTADGNLTLDFRAGFAGKLCLRPGPQVPADSVLMPHYFGHKTLGRCSPLPSTGPSLPSSVPHNELCEPVGELCAARAALDGNNKATQVIPDSQAGQSMAGLSWGQRSPTAVHNRLEKEQAAGDKAAEAESPVHVRDSAEVDQTNEESQQQMPSKLGQATQFDNSNPTEAVAPAGEAARPIQEESQPADAVGVPVEVIPEPAAQAQEHLPERSAKGQKPSSGDAATDEAAGSAAKACSQEGHSLGDNGAQTPLHGQQASKENTPSAANLPAKQKGKRKSEGNGQPSNGKRSGKKQKGTPGSTAASMSFQWRPLDCKGPDGVPRERWGATFTALNSTQVCLFAGNSTDDQLGDTWVLDVAEPQWRRLPVQQDPGRAWHSAELVPGEEGKHVFAIGGERVQATAAEDEKDDEDGGECLCEVCQLDLDANLWFTLPITGEQLQRAGHSTTLLPDNRVLLFGGIDNEGRYRNDAYILDTRRLSCFSLAGSIVRGAPPKPRAYHTATLVGKSIIVLGGTGTRAWSLKEVYSLSVETWQWKEHTAVVEGEAPTPRSGHSAVALPGERHLLVFGGGIPDSNTFFSTVAVLDTHTWTWSYPTLQGVARPCGRSGHGMALVQLPDGRPALATHGGRTHDESLCKDTWLLEINT